MSETGSQAAKAEHADPSRRCVVFGYGSLVNRENLDKYFASLNVEVQHAKLMNLHGFRRNWRVAMNNWDTIPGYKYYVDETSGERPDASVCFLNISPVSDDVTNGIGFVVPQSVLAYLDKRERNYDRIDVSKSVSDAIDDLPVWTYIASGAGESRYLDGESRNRLLIDAHYKEDVEKAFQSLGETEYQRFLNSTDTPRIPVRRLRRLDVPDKSEP